MKHATLVMAALALLFGGVGQARAGIIYQTGFEPPAYTLGTLKGQAGWFNSSIPVVQNSTVLSGTQAAEFDASLLPAGQSLVDQLISFSPLNNSGSLVRIQESFFLSATGGHSLWDVMAVGGIGQLLVFGNDMASLGLASTSVGSVPVTRGQWNLFEVDLNYQTQIQSAFVNGVFIGQGPFASQTTSLSTVAFGINDFPGTDKAFVDNLSITSVSSVPEPASLTLLGLGSVGLLGFGWRRRKMATALGS